MQFPSKRKCDLSASKSPHLLIQVIFLSFLSPSFSFSGRIISVEKFALLKFKASVSDPSGLLSNWADSGNSHNDFEFEHCSWYGVTCDSDHRVSSLRISGGGGGRGRGGNLGRESSSGGASCFDVSKFPFYGFGIRRNCSSLAGKLTGKLSPAIGNFSSIRVLSLPFNEFSGEIPGEIWGLEGLEVLDLEGNSISGNLPSVFSGLRKLRVLNLGFNRITGEIPHSISKLGELELVNLASNGVHGAIPGFLGDGSGSKLWGLYLSMNRLTGEIPHELGSHCGRLEYLDLSGNQLNGSIPARLGYCGNLRAILLFSNRLQGFIPSSFGQLRKLEVLDVSRNNLSGPVPVELGNCVEMSVLVLSNLYDPFLENGGSRRISMPLSVAAGEGNCFGGSFPLGIAALPKLRVLWAPKVALRGMIPRTWGSCDSLEMINLSMNYFTGGIKGTFGGCINLIYVDLSSNMISGELDGNIMIPCMIMLNVRGNNLLGTIPIQRNSMCRPMPSWVSGPDIWQDPASTYLFFFASRPNLGIPPFSFTAKHVVVHDFGGNNFTGPIPPLPIASSRLGRMTEYAFLADGNSLAGTFPGNLFDRCERLNGIFVKISNNKLRGRIPIAAELMCRLLKYLDVSGNKISGFIPRTLGNMESLVLFDRNGGELYGQLPIDLGQLKYLKYFSLVADGWTVDPCNFLQLNSIKMWILSSLSLSAEPSADALNLHNLTILVLGRHLSGFDNARLLYGFNASSYDDFILGCSLINCSSALEHYRLYFYPVLDSKFPSRRLLSGSKDVNYDVSPSSGSDKFNSVEIASIVCAAVIILVFVCLVILLIYARKCLPEESSRVEVLEKREITTFREFGVPLTFEKIVESTENFSASNCIGSGGFGATYKAEISPGNIVAVKRLAVGRFHCVQQFHAEIQTLGKIRHDNLVTLLGYHASEAEMFLVYNYLPQGNLEAFIKERGSRKADWKTVHKIALDIASALAYLHDDCDPRVIHRDVKPSNILLDDDLNAYLSDFGLCRLMGPSETHATTRVAGTFGYLAPEYALTCRVSEKCDVYSYGVVLLELISDKKALDPSFSSHGNGFNIVPWACMLMRQGRSKEVINAALWDEGPQDDLVEVLYLAVKCTVDTLSVRPAMKQVVQRLRKLRPRC